VSILLLIYFLKEGNCQFKIDHTPYNKLITKSEFTTTTTLRKNKYFVLESFSKTKYSFPVRIFKTENS